MTACNKAILYLTFLLNFVKQKFVLLLHVTGALYVKQWVVPRLLRTTPALLPSLDLSSYCKPGALPSSLSNHSSQPRGVATQKKRALNQLREEEGGKRERENALETQLIKKIEKEWQNPNRLRSCDWKKCFSWAGEKGWSFPGCSSWCETSWAQRQRTGRDELFFILWLRLKFLLKTVFLKGTVLKSSKRRKKEKETKQASYKTIKTLCNIALI